jgi:hypothetical protein
MPTEAVDVPIDDTFVMTSEGRREPLAVAGWPP